MKPRCFQIQSADNVGTMIDDVNSGEIDVIGASREQFAVNEKIPAGHKVALRDIARNEPVTKYGVRIGHATAFLRRGTWVHLHNLASDLDERSSTLDIHSGAPTDTRYE